MKRVIQALVPLLILVVGLSVFFQGLPWQFRVKEEYGSLRHNTLTVMETMKEEDIPEGWKEYSVDGIAFYAPSGLRYDEDESSNRGGSCYTDGGTTVTVYDSFSGETHSVDDSLKELGITAADLRWFCKRTSKPYPLDEFEFIELCSGLSPTDLDIHSYKQSKIFYSLVELCPQLYDYPSGSFRADIIKGSNIRIYAATMSEEGKMPYIMATVYPDKDKKLNVCIEADSTVTETDIARTLHQAAAAEES